DVGEIHFGERWAGANDKGALPTVRVFKRSIVQKKRSLLRSITAFNFQVMQTFGGVVQLQLSLVEQHARGATKNARYSGLAQRAHDFPQHQAEIPSPARSSFRTTDKAAVHKIGISTMAYLLMPITKTYAERLATKWKTGTSICGRLRARHK